MFTVRMVSCRLSWLWCFPTTAMLHIVLNSHNACSGSMVQTQCHKCDIQQWLNKCPFIQPCKAPVLRSFSNVTTMLVAKEYFVK